MLKNRAAMWLLGSIVLWIGVAGAEPLLPNEPAGPEGDDQALIGRGVVVESVGKGSALEKAGIQQGDLIVAWERLPNPPSNPQGAHGRIEDYGDWIALKEEQSPRGSFRLEIHRGPDHRVVEIPLANWNIRTRPNLTSAEGACLKELAGHVLGGGSPADSCWPTVFPTGRPSGHEGAFFWLGVSLAKSLAKAGRTKEAQDLLETIIAQQSVTELQVPALWALGTLRSEVGEIEAARNAYRQAAQLVEVRQGKNLLWARCKTGLFSIALLDGTEALLHEDLLELLALRQSLAPGSAEVAASLSNLAVVESQKGDFEAAAEHYKEALDIGERLEPAGKDVATILANYSAALWRAGDLGKAEQSARRSLDLREQLNAGAEDIFSALINLGAIVDEKGDLDAAEEFYSRALSLVESSPQLAPYKLFILDDLGELYWKRGEYERAESFLTDALSILGRPARVDGREIALLNNLGIIEKRKGNYKKARSRFVRARQLAEILAPNSADDWAALENLALLDVSEGRASSSIHWSRRALRVVHEFGPGSLYEARSLMTLSEAYLLQAGYTLAEGSLVKALSILQTYTGQPIEKAQAFSLLAKLKLRRGEPRKAADLFEKAAQAVEHAASFSGGRFQDVLRYRDLLLTTLDGYIGAFADAGMFQEAFRALESKRARSFAALLRERDLKIKESESGDLTTERQLLDRKYDHLQVELLRLSESGRQADLATVLKKLHDTDARLSQVSSRIKLSSPRLASLYDLEIPEAAELRKAAPKGVLFLSFTTESDRSFVFSMASDVDLRCVTIKAGLRELSDKINRFRSLLAESRGNSQLSTVREAALGDVGRQLYRLLLEPVEGLIESHERILIVADGPLQLLPFGALRLWVPGGPQDVEQLTRYVTSWKPLHFASSLSTYVGQINGGRSAAVADNQPSQLAFVGFGAPFVAKEVDSARLKVSDVEDYRVARLRGFLERDLLLHSRREVEAISSLFPAGQVKIFVGKEATEESAKAVGEDFHIIHFATHALLDDRFPLSSSLVLAMPANPQVGTGNGLLQVWEIFEQMRLNADLVVLSGCETALGEEDGGEGLMGLARAFQYAGARSVLASLWSVNDLATSELMIRFYKHLRAGLPKDQALQAAQQELIQGPIEIVNEKGERESRDFSAPYYWAGFQLYGDWQ
jgi:CHAT domain-containing protein/Tfp pilus assembly protein PilF